MPRRHPADGRPAHDVEIDVDAAVDALYADDPDQFTAARDDLVRRLRAAGRRDDAATVKKLRRPTVAAWAVNRVAREQAADDVARLRDLGDDLRRAQADVLGRGADAEELRALGARRRTATAPLVEAALAALAEAGVSPESHRDDIVGAFDAVVADPAAADEVTAARLTRPPTPPVGLGAPDAAILMLAGPAETVGTPSAKQRPRKGAAPATSTQGGRVHVLDAAEVRKARARAAKAREAAEAATHEVARLEAALTAARREAARAKDAVARAEAAAEAADAAATRSTG